MMRTPVSSAIKAVLLWLMVLVPLGWGVSKSVEKSMPLFREVRPAKMVPPAQPVDHPH